MYFLLKTEKLVVKWNNKWNKKEKVKYSSRIKFIHYEEDAEDIDESDDE